MMRSDGLDDLSPTEIGEDALSLMLGRLPVAWAQAILVHRHHRGDTLQAAMLAALQYAQRQAVAEWHKIMPEGSTIPGGIDLSSQLAVSAGRAEGALMLLAIRLRNALDHLQSGDPLKREIGVELVAAAAEDAKKASATRGTDAAR